VAILGVFLSLSCSRTSEADQALRAEPISAFRPASGELVSTSSSGDGETFGIRTKGGIANTFVPAAGHTVDDVIVEVVSAAREDGWDIRERSVGVSYRGEKSLADREGRLDVTYSEESDRVVVRLSLLG
jgi:hypothetical protein